MPGRERFSAICSLFASWVLHSFALIDFLSLLGLMRGGTEVTFDEEHPAPALRFKMQIERLEKDQWWDTVENLDSDHIRLSKRLASTRVDYEFVFRNESIPGFVEAFRAIELYIPPLVESI